VIYQLKFGDSKYPFCMDDTCQCGYLVNDSVYYSCWNGGGTLVVKFRDPTKEADRAYRKELCAGKPIPAHWLTPRREGIYRCAKGFENPPNPLAHTGKLPKLP